MEISYFLEHRCKFTKSLNQINKNKRHNNSAYYKALQILHNNAKIRQQRETERLRCIKFDKPKRSFRFV